jgi:hypothetical protein
MSATIEIEEEIDQFTEYTVAAQIVQMSLFPDITQDDVRKTLWLLRMYPETKDVIRNYELAKEHMRGGMSEYDLASAHGGPNASLGRSPLRTSRQTQSF